MLSRSGFALAKQLTFLISEHLHLAAEHGPEQGVLPGEHLKSGIVQISTDVELHIFVSSYATVGASPGLGTSPGRD